MVTAVVNRLKQLPDGMVHGAHVVHNKNITINLQGKKQKFCISGAKLTPKNFMYAEIRANSR